MIVQQDYKHICTAGRTNYDCMVDCTCTGCLACFFCGGCLAGFWAQLHTTSFSRMDGTIIGHSFTDFTIACLFINSSTECISIDCTADCICMDCLLMSLVAIAQQDYKHICTAGRTNYICTDWATDHSSIGNCLSECIVTDCTCMDVLALS